MSARFLSFVGLAALTLAACGEKRPPSNAPSAPAAQNPDSSATEDAAATEGNDEEKTDEDLVPPPDSPEYAPLD